MEAGTPAVYRPADDQPWQDVEIVGYSDDGKFLLREVGKIFGGVWLAGIDQVRIQEPMLDPETASCRVQPRKPELIEAVRLARALQLAQSLC
jgi:hypothetical protein